MRAIILEISKQQYCNWYCWDYDGDNLITKVFVQMKSTCLYKFTNLLFFSGSMLHVSILSHDKVFSKRSYCVLKILKTKLENPLMKY